LTSRFVSEDPIGFGGGDLNLYGYVGGAPIDRFDPSGESWKDKLVGAAKSAGLYDMYQKVRKFDQIAKDMQPAQKRIEQRHLAASRVTDPAQIDDELMMARHSPEGQQQLLKDAHELIGAAADIVSSLYASALIPLKGGLKILKGIGNAAAKIYDSATEASPKQCKEEGAQ
jgi:hypothetical protein